MNQFRKTILIVALIGVSAACNLPANATPTSQLNVATVVASTLQVATNAEQTSVALATPTFTPTPTVTTSSTPQGLTITYLNVNLIIPSNLANGTTNTSSTGVEFPYTNPSFGNMPQHIKMILNGYPIQGTNMDPQILVFKADEYSRYGDGNQQFISGLRNMHYQHGQSFPGVLPAGLFNAAVQSVNFTNGHGIRYLTQFDQSPFPINNRELIYYFHGITNDGQYYVQAILPLQAPFLAPDENPNSALPANGIPFNTSQPQAYFNAVARKLNATPADQFSPSLASLDSLVQSMTVNP